MSDALSVLRGVALVTGASSGNGRGIALSLAAAGMEVACADLRPDPCPGGFEPDAELTTDELIRSRGGSARHIAVDVADGEQVEAMVAETVDAFGRLDLLVNNAGIMPRNPTTIVEDTEENFDRVMAVNAKGAWLASRAALARMSVQPLEGRIRGRIVNVASVSGALTGLPGFTQYATSKGALSGMTVALAAEWAASKITVNAIAPGFFPTAMTGHVYANADVARAMASVVPLGEFGRPEDLGGVVVFLASPSADYLTGLMIPVDGGYTRIGALPSIEPE